MIKSYILTTLRAHFRSPLYTLINVVGLSVGMAVFLLALTYVADELSYDRHHPSAERVYRVLWENKTDDGNVRLYSQTPAGVAHELASEYPEVEAATFIWNWGPDARLRIGDRIHDGVAFCLADPRVFDVLDIPFERGDRSVLAGIGSVVVTASKAKELFGDADPVGQRIRVDSKWYGGRRR